MKYPPIGDYALIGDCHSAALVSRTGSIDWCCLPRFDSDSCFGRLLDWRRGGYFEITPTERCSIRREYLGGSLILVTTFTRGRSEARLIDFFAMREGGRSHPRRELVRIIEGVRGRLAFTLRCAPRLDFGEVTPWIYGIGHGASLAAGGNTALLIFGDAELAPDGMHALRAQLDVTPGVRRHVAVQFVSPSELERARDEDHASLAAHYQETLEWWRAWASKLKYPAAPGVCIVRSAITLKALTYAPSGAIIAAPTTSLPERIGGERNWDYRFSWIRDSVFTVRSLSALGAEAEADGFRRFILRTAAGNGEEVQVMYAVDGKRRLPEVELDQLEGWRGSRPVRIGNGAVTQYQADMFGLLLELTWRWSERGKSVQANVRWDFLTRVIESAIAKWRQPDRGMWEVRSRPRHFVHSKVMCWAAVRRGVELAVLHSLPAPLARWRKELQAMRATIERRGVDPSRGCFVASFGSTELDAALLLLPGVDFVSWRDERMLLTADAIHEELTSGGLVQRYRSRDGLKGDEGAFVACTFWLAECFAHQGRLREARRLFERATRCGNDLGLFSEEYSPQRRQLLGNFPQGLTHLAHISAALALTAG